MNDWQKRTTRSKWGARLLHAALLLALIIGCLTPAGAQAATPVIAMSVQPTINATSLVINGDFSSGAAGWSSSGNVGFVSGAAAFSGGNSPVNGVVWQQVASVDGQWYAFDYDVIRIGPGAGTPQVLVEVIDANTSAVIDSTLSAGGAINAVVHKTLAFLAPGPVILRFTDQTTSTTDLDLNLDNVSLVGHSGCYPQPPNLVSWWRAQGNANDSIGSHNGSLQNGATYGSGKVGLAFSLNGANQYVSIPSSAGIEMRNNLTVMAWFKVNSLAVGGYAKVFSKRPGTFGPIEISLYNDGTKITASTQLSTDGANWSTISSSQPLSVGTWYHTAFVVDSNNLHALYIDGQSQGTLQLPGQLMSHTGAPFLIGLAHVYPLNGLVDDVQILNRALSPVEIARIFNVGSNGICNSPNRTPVAAGESYSATQETLLVIPAPGVLDNDSDEDGNPLYAVKVSDPAHGSLSVNEDGSFSYTPESGFGGSDSFTYKATDGVADSNTVAVNLDVNFTPAATDDSYITEKGLALDVPAPGVLENDSDTDGDSLSAVKVSDPAHGTLLLNSDGGFSYTPQAGYAGSDSFTYAANDGTANSSAATVQITIMPEVGDLSLLGYWKFDEPLGTTTADASSNGNTGVLSGGVTFSAITAPITNYSNLGAISMSASNNSLVTVPNSAINKLTNNFTVMGWIRPSSTSGLQRVISSARTVSSSNGWGFGFNGGYLNLEPYGKSWYQTSTRLVSTGQWYHITAVMDSSNAVSFYLNGVFVEKINGSGPAVADNDDVLLIGARTNSGATSLTNQYNGLIDDLHVFDRALNAEEVASLVGVPPCSETVLRARIALGEAGPSKTIILDGACTYPMSFAANSSNGGSGAYLFTATKIEGNGATIERSSGAAPFRLLTASTALTITNLTLRNGNVINSGGALLAFGNLNLNNVRFENNTAANLPGAAYVNTGGAIKVIGSLTANKTVFVNNQTGGFGGAIYFSGPLAHITNSIFANNLSGAPGAAIAAGSATGSLTLLNNSFTNQYKNEREAVLVNGTANIQNNIFDNFTSGLNASGATAIVNEDYNLFSANDNETQALSGGTVNRGGHSRMAASPRFADPAGGNYRLQASSSAIDLGGNVIDLPAVDADGNPRPFGPAVDMGAYEYQGPGIPAVSITKSGPPFAAASGQTQFILTVINEGSNSLDDLRITDQLPAGATYVAGSASAGGVYDAGSITWDLSPLGPNQRARVWYQVTASQSLVSSVYSVSSISNPAITAGGPVFTTTYDASFTALGFAPFPDGYSFANWGAPTLDSDITQSDMPAIYGSSVCKTQDPCVLKAAAEAERQVLASKSSGGHCGGMAMSSLFIYDRADIVPASYQPGAINTFDLSKDNARNLVVFFHSTQTASPANTSGLAPYNVATGANDVVQKLLVNFADPSATNRYTLWFFKPDWSGGHAVVPYAVKSIDADHAWIYVYDVNYPNNYNRVFKITFSTNAWVYEGAAINPDAPASAWSGDASEPTTIRLKSLRWAERFPKVCSAACAPEATVAAANRIVTVPLSYDFQLEGEGSLMITRSDGKRAGIDPASGQFIAEIPGAELNMDPTGLLNVSGSLHIPHTAGMTYSLRVSDRQTAYGNASATADVNIMGQGYVTRLKGLKINSPADPESVQPGSNDVVSVIFDGDNHRLVFQSSTLDSDTPALAMAISQNNAPDYTFEVSGAQMPSGRSLAVALDPATGRLTIENDDPASNSYSLDVERINMDGSKISYHSDGLSDGSGTGAQVDLGSSWTGGAPAITPTNLPVATGDSYETLVGHALTTVAAAGVLSNDTGAQHMEALLVSGPTHGMLTLNADGSFTYTPNSGYLGEDSFTYQASTGLYSSNPVTVMITVKPYMTYIPLVATAAGN